MHTILLKHASPRTSLDLFERIFWRQGKTLAVPALAIYEMIRKGGFTSDERTRKHVQEELGIKHSQYYHILNTLKAVGLISKSHGEFRPSAEFAFHLKAMFDIVMDWRTEK